jgi:hypothetical protein
MIDGIAIKVIMKAVIQANVMLSMDFKSDQK